MMATTHCGAKWFRKKEWKNVFSSIVNKGTLSLQWAYLKENADLWMTWQQFTAIPRHFFRTFRVNCSNCNFNKVVPLPFYNDNPITSKTICNSIVNQCAGQALGIRRFQIPNIQIRIEPHSHRLLFFINFWNGRTCLKLFRRSSVSGRTQLFLYS